jgi:NAD dependent epimerase/dehydratase family enzyme
MAWMAALGAWAMRTEPELVLKSRRVIARRLPESGFAFQYPEWPAAASDLVRRMRSGATR